MERFCPLDGVDPFCFSVYLLRVGGMRRKCGFFMQRCEVSLCHNVCNVAEHELRHGCIFEEWEKSLISSGVPLEGNEQVTDCRGEYTAGVLLLSLSRSFGDGVGVRSRILLS